MIDEKGALDWQEALLTAALLGEKRGAAVGPTNRAKETRWMVVVDGQGIPIGGTLASASPAEVKLDEETIMRYHYSHVQ